MKLPRIKTVVGVGIGLLTVAAIIGVAYLRQPRLTPALRGSEVAESMGCFACHGPGATGGVPNPGSEEEVVPAWDGGNAMMYVNNETEIREWILYGHPRRLQKEHAEHEHGASSDHESSLPIEMPAFEGIISDKDLNDLVAYYKAVAFYEDPPPDAREGYRIASRHGCFGCHGPGGRVGASNPRSFKGYIPPWKGRDYADLVRNEEELRSWILDGHIDRFESNPLATYFTRRQVIHMPAYRDALDEEEIDALVAYIQWLNES